MSKPLPEYVVGAYYRKVDRERVTLTPHLCYYPPLRDEKSASIFSIIARPSISRGLPSSFDEFALDAVPSHNFNV